jgi:hypothetical protein
VGRQKRYNGVSSGVRVEFEDVEGYGDGAMDSEGEGFRGSEDRGRSEMLNFSARSIPKLLLTTPSGEIQARLGKGRGGVFGVGRPREKLDRAQKDNGGRLTGAQRFLDEELSAGDSRISDDAFHADHRLRQVSALRSEISKLKQDVANMEQGVASSANVSKRRDIDHERYAGRDHYAENCDLSEPGRVKKSREERLRSDQSRVDYRDERNIWYPERGHYRPSEELSRDDLTSYRREEKREKTAGYRAPHWQSRRQLPRDEFGRNFVDHDEGVQSGKSDEARRASRSYNNWRSYELQADRDGKDEHGDQLSEYADDEARDRGQRWSRERVRRSRSSSLKDRRGSSPRRKPAKPDRYDGTGSVEAFLEQFRTCAQYNRWDEEDKYVQLKLCLRGSAVGLLKEDVTTFEALQGKLQQRFNAKGREVSFRAQLRARRRQRGETLQDLYINIGDLMHHAYPGKPTEHRDSIAIDAFIDALDDAGLEQRVRDKMPENLDDAYKLAVIMEANSRGAELKSCVGIPRVRETRQDVRGIYTEAEQVPRTSFLSAGCTDEQNKQANAIEISDLKEAVNMLCLEVAKIREEGSVRRSGLSTLAATAEHRPKSSRSCFICGDMTHFASRCPMKGGLVQNSGASNVATNQTEPEPVRPVGRLLNEGNRGERPVRCYNCGETGHIARNCPTVSRGSSQDLNRRNVQVNVTTSSVLTEVPVYLQMKVRSVTWDCLLDSGCAKSVIPAKLVTAMSLKEAKEQLFAANGTAIGTLGRVEVPLRLGEFVLGVDALVSNHVREPILGVDWLKRHKCIWDYGKDQINIRGIDFELISKEAPSACRRIVAVRREEIPPWCQSTVQGRVEIGSMYEPIHNQWCTEPTELQPGLCVARTLVPDRLDGVPVRVINVSMNPIVLTAGTELSWLTAVDVPGELETEAKTNIQCRIVQDGARAQRVVKSAENTQEEGWSASDLLDESPATGFELEPLIENLSPCVSPEEKQRTWELIEEFSDIFSKNEFDIGMTSLGVHSIDTQGSRPIKQPLRRHPIHLLQTIDEQVDQMMAADIIEPSDSSWAANLVMVKKRDGSYRVCVDLRALNTVTRKDAYPLPRIDACLDSLAGSRLFSTFDLTSGYFQVRMDPNDADKTAFVTRRGLYRFKRLVMGLCNAGSTFSRIMQLAMEGLNLEICLTYLDDIIVFATDVPSMLQRLRTVFQRLRESGLKLKPSKCRLIQDKVAFLGHVVSAAGVDSDPKKI